MEFGGFLGLDGQLVGSSSDHHSHSLGGGGAGGSCLFSMDNSSSSSTLATELPMKQQQRSLFGGFLKHGRSSAAAASASASETAAGQEQQVDWRSLKLARTASSTTTTATTTEQMLSFSTSSSKPEQYTSLYHLNSDGYHNHYYPYSSSSSSAAAAAHSSFRSAGLGCGSTNVSIHGTRGPFTPSQWMELEHQALIYKYIDANIPIPSSLLVPIRRSTNPSSLSPFLSGSYRSTTLGWGPFHLGFSGNADPEPGRCRRTDGKKWRCSRDAVADQKYCERHMNRGRHRSRKHVEGHSGQASKAVPVIAPSQPAGAAVSGGGGGLSNNALTIMSQQNKSLQPNEPSPPRTDRIQMSKENTKYHVRDSNGLSLLDDTSPKPLDSLFPVPKHQNPFEGTLSRPDFGLISTDSLLNPMRTTYSEEDVGFDPASKLHDRQPQHHHPLRHFIDDWPKSQSELPSIAWPKLDEMKSDRTQLSISIPSEISSSSSSPNQEKLALSPLRLSREFNPTSGGSQRQSGWIPISWEPSIGGPLGEVLNKTNSTPKDFASSSLNLLPDGWDTSPRMQSSPTGVLQKTAFGSLSSSTGSSPRAENNKAAGDSTGVQCDNLLGATLANPSTVGSV